jgi:hypothetical protein
MPTHRPPRDVPPTVVHAALGLVLAAAALGPAFDRRALAVAPLAAAVPDLDAAVGLLGGAGGLLPVGESTHGAVLHTLLIPLGIAAVLFLDARAAEPRVVDRLGPAGVRLAWVAVAVYAVAGIGLDLFNVATANPLWPLHDQFYAVVGTIQFTNQELFVQTFVAFGRDGHAVYVGQQGGTGEFFVASPLNPTRGPDAGAERVLTVADSGWQLLVLLASPVVGWAALRSGAAADAVAAAGDDPGGGATTVSGAEDATDSDDAPAPTDD